MSRILGNTELNFITLQSIEQARAGDVPTRVENTDLALETMEDWITRTKDKGNVFVFLACAETKAAIFGDKEMHFGFPVQVNNDIPKDLIYMNVNSVSNLSEEALDKVGAKDSGVGCMVVRI